MKTQLIIEGVIHEIFPRVLQPFDEIEIHPCIQDPEGNVSVCEEKDADFWSVYYHLVEGGVDSIADFNTQKQAESFRSFLYSFAQFNRMNK